MVKTKQTENEKRRYAVMGQQYIKGRRIKLTPNEKSLLGLIVYRSQSEGSIHLANKTICGVFGWGPEQVNRACKGLISKGIITKDRSAAVHGQQGSEYTLLEGNETEQQPTEQQLEYQPIVIQAPAEPPHVKPFHEQQTQPNDNEVVALLKQQLEPLRQQNELLKQQLETLNKKVELLLNTLISQNKSSVSPSNPSVDTLPVKKEITPSTPTPQTDLDNSDDEPPTPNEPFQSDYLMAITAADEGGTIGGLTDTQVEPTEQERLVQEARQRARKVMNNCEENGMPPRQAAMKAREAIEEEYSSKLWGDSVFQNMLSLLNSYAFGGSEEFDI